MGCFNILLDHTVYTEPYMKQIMPNNTVYIASLREPFSHFKSAAAYFNIFNSRGTGIDLADGMETFLKDLKNQDDVHKSHLHGLSLARNFMAFDLGFPTGFQRIDQGDNFTAIKQWLDHTQQVFSVVLLSDYFSHSLVMLKRILCWSTKDIIYHRMNSQNSKYKPRYPTELIENFYRWSAADYLAYQLFNRTLWERIERWGSEDFMQELRQYERTRTKVLDFCNHVSKGQGQVHTIYILRTRWDAAFTFNVHECKLLLDHMRDVMVEQYENKAVAADINNKTHC
jgi:hypothetical protein